MPVNSVNNSLLIGVSGLQTTQALLNTTTRNITNEQTPGYVVKRQQAVSNAATGGSLPGVIQRLIDASLQQKLRENNSASTFAQTRANALTQMNQLSGDPAQGTSISAKINNLLSAFQSLSANPQSAGTAQAVLNAAQDLAQNFNSQTNALFALQQTASQNVPTEVAQINTDLQNIASLNQQVLNATANGRDPTDLQDQRDIAVNDLSKLMTVHAFLDNQGVLQVLSGDYTPLAGLYSAVVTSNPTNNTISVSGNQLNTVGGQLGANLQVLTTDTLQRLQNLSELANHVTSEMQALPTSLVGLTGTLHLPPAAVGGPDIAIPGVSKFITDNGNQYSCTLAYRSLGAGPPANSYQVVIASMTPIEGGVAVTNNGYVAATGTGGYVLGTVTFPPGAPGTAPAAFSGQQVQLNPSVAGTVPGKIGPVGALYPTPPGLLSTAGASVPNNVTTNNTINLFTQSNGAPPGTTLNFAGNVPGPGVEAAGDSAASLAFTLTTDNGNQYTAQLALRPVTPGAFGSGYNLVVTSLTPVGNAPPVGNLNYNGPASTGGIVIGTFDSAGGGPNATFFSNNAITAIPAGINTPAQFPGHIEPITFTGAVGIGGGPVIAGAVTATNIVVSPFYSGNIQVNPSLSLRAIQVGDQFATTPPDTNVGAAQGAAQTFLNRQMIFSTVGVTGTQSVQAGSTAAIVGIGQDLANTNNSITALTTANTQIQRAIAPLSEVNLDNEMSNLVVLQNLYQANAKVVTTVSKLLDTLIALPT